MKYAHYHQESGPKKLAVVKENEDETVDLALKPGSPAVVTNCEITDSPVIGSCTDTVPLEEQEKEPASKKEKK